jgi:glutamate-1-semialdehyde 2,1-aminomutase/spore coat polysaccharide biosynthesis protein SpsF
VRVGAHVFVEKPLSDTLRGVGQLISEARQRQRIVQVGYNLRFNAGLIKLKEVIDAGAVGKVMWVHAEAGQYLPDWRPWQDYSRSYSARRDLGGGILLDGSHELDYICWLLGRPTEIMCMAGKVSTLDVSVEDCAAVLMRFSSGAQAEVHLDFVQQGYTRTCKVVGESGTVVWDFESPELKLFLAKEKRWQGIPIDPAAEKMYVAEVRHFLDCVRSGKTPLVDLKQARDVLELVLSAKSSSSSHDQSVSLWAERKGKVVAVIQARMGSSRLPGKTMADIEGHPMLWHVVQRVKRAALVNEIVVATSELLTDDPIARFCEQEDIRCFRGSENDVLDRYYQAARAESADVVVRVTGDCPLIDPSVIDKVVECFLTGEYDYASNTLVRTYPDGLDAEVFSFQALEEAWKQATRPSDREHVTPYLHSPRFRTFGVENDVALPRKKHRWTVDEIADLEFVRGVYAGLRQKTEFGMSDVLDYLNEQTELQDFNASITSNEGYYRSLLKDASAEPVPNRSRTQSENWFRRAQKVIPGCAQTFSKGYNQHVQGVAPIFLERGQGCRVWDVDGNEYIDYIQGLLPNILGYDHPEVNAAVALQLSQGHSFSLPHPLEVELAERLVRLIPCAEMVRFGKNGSDATSGAVRAARAFTKKDRVACCGYHGWQDWFIGSTTRNAGVPRAVRELTHPFPYNDLPALEYLLASHPNEFAAVIMEPFNFVEPAPGYLNGVKELAARHGAVLIFDEICSGFHFGLGGAQKRFGVTPDLACLGKAMGNGFPISCIVGSAKIMKIFEEIFFSFTFAGEVSSIAAALKVLDVLEFTDVLKRMEAQGRTLQDGVNMIAKHAGLSDRVTCVGDPSWSLMKFLDADGRDSLLVRSLFAQECSKRGVLLLATHNMTAAHDLTAIEQTLKVYAEVLKAMAIWLNDPHPEARLEGKAIEPVFKVR